MAEILNEKQLNTGFVVYRILKRDDENFPEFFFGSPEHAILWALFTEPELYPIPVNTTIKEFMKTFVGSLSKAFRFPKLGYYVLAEYTYSQDIKYLRTDSLEFGDSEFYQESSQNPDIPIYYPIRGESTLLSAEFTNYVANNQTDTIVDDDLAFFGISRSVSTDSHEFRLGALRYRNKYDPNLIRTFNHYINWDIAWNYFSVIVFNAGVVSLDNLVQTFNGFIKTKEFADKLFTGGNTPGYTECIDVLSGFINPGNSCFMDSTLMAMFAFKNSPFTEHMIVNPNMNTRPAELLCSDDIEVDLQIRKDIRAMLHHDVRSIMRGSRLECSQLRYTLGKLCRMPNKNKTPDEHGRIPASLQTDLSVGFHDPSEMYSRLCSALNYNPVVLIEQMTRAMTGEGMNARAARIDVQNSTMLPPLRVSDPDLHQIAWPYTWQSEYENIGSGDDYTWRKDDVSIESADCLVVHVDRRYLENQGPIMRGDDEIDDSLLASFGLSPSSPVKAPETSGISTELLASFGFSTKSIYTPPSSSRSSRSIRPRFTGVPVPDETRVNARELDVSQQFDVDINGEIIPYVLKAVVYSPYDGHYATLLKCGTGWYNYDDTRTETVIARNPVDEYRADNLIQTRGVLLFYYPPFPEISRVDQARIEQLIAELQIDN